ncbi:hypothetical protein D3C80_2115140 [compost metagenome]
MAEAHVGQGREGLLKLLGQAHKGFRALGQAFVQLAGKGIDGVEAAPQDAVVGGFAQVVELVAGVGNAVAPLPANEL